MTGPMRIFTSVGGERVLGGVVAFAMGLASFASAGAQAGTPSLVIDQCADLTHIELKAFLNTNASELSGSAGIDDDSNGFIDDLNGWNLVSNDAEFMPAYVLKLFNENKADITMLFDLYGRIENGDEEALNELRQHPELIQVLSTLLNISHGTHVSGIVQKNSAGSALLQNINIFTSSKQEEGAQSEGLARLARPASAELAGLSRIAARLRLFSEEGSAPETPASSFNSMFDDRAALEQLLENMRNTETAEALRMAAYVGVSHSKVVNLSIGSALPSIYEILEGIWQQELAQAGLDASTPRSALQEENFQFVATTLWSMRRAYWASVFGSAPEVLFVVAAGNDSADLDAHRTLPAEYSTEFANVITVAATNPQGVLADFSNYNAKSVNIGAWGTAVPSLAPADMTVVMSGTSMASPLVAGVATHLREVNPALTAAEVRKIIEETGTPVASLAGKVSSGKLIDPTAAVSAAERAKTLGVTFGITSVNSAKLMSGNWMDLFGLSSKDYTAGKVVQTPEVVKQLMRKF